MSALTDRIAAKLDGHIIENFADIYTMEDELAKLERTQDLDDPEVIAAIATCADVAAAQARLTARPPAALAKGLTAALARPKLRATAVLLIQALLAGATLEQARPVPPPAPKSKQKPLPAFARPERLPALIAKGKPASVAEVEAAVRAIATATLDDPPELDYTTESLTALGRALALGWLSHGADPKQVWGAHAASHFPDDATARDLAMMAKELAPRVGQFGKAQVLVDVLAAMDTRAALAQLLELTKVKTRSVKDRARAAFDAAAKRSGITEHDLADKLIPDGAPVGKDFAKRLEQRMITGATMTVTELVENILQRDAVRTASRGVVFFAKHKSKLTTFAIGDDGLIDRGGHAVTPPTAARIGVVYPLELSKSDLAAWRERIAAPPFSQLDRPVQRFMSLRAMVKHAAAHARSIAELEERYLHALEGLGWKRGAVVGGSYSELVRELDGITVTLEVEPGVYLGRGMARLQRVTKVTARGKGPPRAMAEVAREIETLR